MVTTQNIVDFIKDGTYPYSFRFVAGEQRYKVYPMVEVVESAPRSKSETPETITETQTFEIKVYVRYIRTLAEEISNLETTETEIMSQLHSESLESGQFFSEDKGWSRTQLSDVYGAMSVLRLTFQEITPRTTNTRVGAGTTLTLGSTTVKLIRGSTGDFGRESSPMFNDIGNKFPIKGQKIGTRTFEYAWKSADYNAIDTLINTGNAITITLSEGSTTTNYTALPVRQRDTVDYAGLKTVVLEIEVQA